MKQINKILSSNLRNRLLALFLTGGIAFTATACAGNTGETTEDGTTTGETTDAGDGTEDVTDATDGTAATETDDVTEAEDTDGTEGDTITLTVGATIVPHSEILEQVKPILAEQGIDLVIVEYTDYVQPNQALISEDLDANFFQHQPYLDSFNSDYNSDLLGLVAVHFEPLSIYKARLESLDDLEEGSEIGVPNDTTNEARALQLLEQEGLITLREGVGLEATPNDIVENELNLEIVELAAENITNVLSSLDLAVINGNYALTADLTADDILASEATDSEASDFYGNVVAVRNGDETRPEIEALIEAITSEAIAEFINEEYQGAVIPLN